MDQAAPKGGGAAHIDAIQLGGKAPSVMTGCRDIHIMKKVGRKDHDIIDAFDKEFDLKFTGLGNDKTLKLTARVEPEIISKTPFQFPYANLYKKIDETARFYTYNLKFSEGGQIPDTLQNNDPNKPFFKQYCRTGSGHPDGFTYGWVSNDDHNLYVKIDFTPDNTMDGDKDYAGVHIKTAKGLKTFTVSMKENDWGSPDFTYTSNAKYQHKVYTFTIPLREIDLSPSGGSQDVQMAIAAYGTASPARQRTKITAGSDHTVELKANGTLWAWGLEHLRSNRRRDHNRQVFTSSGRNGHGLDSNCSWAFSLDSVEIRRNAVGLGKYPRGR